MCCLLTACERKEPVNKQPVQFNVRRDSLADTTAFFQSESDPFHQDSRVESVRKRKLNNTGRLKLTPPVIATNTAEAVDAINHEGFPTYGIVFVDYSTFDFPSFPFDYEQDLAALARLKRSHNLDRIIDENMTDLERVHAVNMYVNQFMSGGTLPDPDTWITESSPSAHEITRLRREEGIGGFAPHYAALFCQLSISIGSNARIVGMHTIDADGEIRRHVVCEVFINSVDKWVVFDAYNNATYYLNNEIPVSALEIRNIMLDGRYSSLIPVIGAGDVTDIVAVREKLVPCYNYLYIWRMNNLLSADNGAPVSWQRLFSTHLVWEDVSGLVRDGKFDRIPEFTDMNDTDFPLTGVRFVTHERGDIDWKLNHVRVHPWRINKDHVRFYLDTCSPNFEKFILANVQESVETTVTDEGFADIENTSELQVFFHARNTSDLAGEVSMIFVVEKILR
jgi:hypothetical protein